MNVDFALELFFLILKFAAVVGFFTFVFLTNTKDSGTYKVSIPEYEYNNRKQVPFVYKPYTDDSGLNMAISQEEHNAANRR